LFGYKTVVHILFRALAYRITRKNCRFTALPHLNAHINTRVYSLHARFNYTLASAGRLGFVSMYWPGCLACISISYWEKTKYCFYYNQL